MGRIWGGGIVHRWIYFVSKFSLVYILQVENGKCQYCCSFSYFSSKMWQWIEYPSTPHFWYLMGQNSGKPLGILGPQMFAEVTTLEGRLNTFWPLAPKCLGTPLAEVEIGPNDVEFLLVFENGHQEARHISVKKLQWTLKYRPWPTRNSEIDFFLRLRHLFWFNFHLYFNIIISNKSFITLIYSFHQISYLSCNPCFKIIFYFNIYILVNF